MAKPLIFFVLMRNASVMSDQVRKGRARDGQARHHRAKNDVDAARSVAPCRSHSSHKF
jgi:hypothetical protein